MLTCWFKEYSSELPVNCSTEAKGNATLFQTCIAEFDKSAFDNYMLFFGQIDNICSYYNGSAFDIIISTDKIIRSAT